MRWTIEDLTNGLCDIEDLGNLKPETAPVVLPPIDLTEKSLRERLRDDALRAYAELGGVEYLKRNPELLDKILAKQAMPEPVAANVNVAVRNEFPWIKSQRLAYRIGLRLASDIDASAADVPALVHEKAVEFARKQLEAEPDPEKLVEKLKRS